MDEALVGTDDGAARWILAATSMAESRSNPDAAVGTGQQTPGRGRRRMLAPADTVAVIASRHPPSRHV